MPGAPEEARLARELLELLSDDRAPDSSRDHGAQYGVL